MAAFGAVLKEFRKARRLSQLDLAVEADVSTRHISFLETGRAKPSREMILHLSRMMAIPSKDVNILLASAGFGHHFQATDLNQTLLSPVRAALTFMLEAHDPYPALVVDGRWNILMVNQSQQRLTEYFIEQGARFPATTNMMDLFFDESGYRPFVDNWEQVACFLLQRIYKEHLLSIDRENRNELLERLLTYSGIPSNWQKQDVGDISTPLVQLELTLGGANLTLFSTIATFGTALDITLQDIRIEHYFPGDETTRQFFQKLAAMA